MLSAYAREHGTKGMDEHRAGAKNVSVCRPLWVRETRRKCLRKRKSWEEGEKKMEVISIKENSRRNSVRRER